MQEGKSRRISLHSLLILLLGYVLHLGFVILSALKSLWQRMNGLCLQSIFSMHSIYIFFILINGTNNFISEII